MASGLVGLAQKIQLLKDKSDEVVDAIKKGEHDAPAKIAQLKKDLIQVQAELLAAQNNLQQQILTSSVATQAASKSGAASAAAQGAAQLKEYAETGKAFVGMIKNISAIKTNIGLIYTETIKTITNIIAMELAYGLKALTKYLNDLKDSVLADLKASLSVSAGIDAMKTDVIKGLNDDLAALKEKLKVTTDPQLQTAIQNEMAALKLQIQAISNV